MIGHLFLEDADEGEVGVDLAEAGEGRAGRGRSILGRRRSGRSGDGERAAFVRGGFVSGAALFTLLHNYTAKEEKNRTQNRARERQIQRRRQAHR